jgi:3-oxoacyl-[acyl-carrier protein] reductase
VRVNALMPASIDTARVRWLDEQHDDPVAARAAREAAIPLGRYGRPEEFGAVAAFVLSPAAGYVTGAVLPVDGGLLRSL